MSDIKDYKWTDCNIDSPFTIINMSKLDGIAIARHFYSQLETAKEKNAFLDEITGSKV